MSELANFFNELSLLPGGWQVKSNLEGRRRVGRVEDDRLEALGNWLDGGDILVQAMLPKHHCTTV